MQKNSSCNARRKTEVEKNTQESCEQENTALRDNKRNSTENVSLPKVKAGQEEKNNESSGG